MNENLETALENMRKKDKTALFFIYQGVDQGMFESQMPSPQRSELLQESFQGVDKAKKVCLQSLRIEFETLKIKIRETIVSRKKTIDNPFLEELSHRDMICL